MIINLARVIRTMFIRPANKSQAIKSKKLKKLWM